MCVCVSCFPTSFVTSPVKIYSARSPVCDACAWGKKGWTLNCSRASNGSGLTRLDFNPIHSTRDRKTLTMCVWLVINQHLQLFPSRSVGCGCGCLYGRDALRASRPIPSHSTASVKSRGQRGGQLCPRMQIVRVFLVLAFFFFLLSFFSVASHGKPDCNPPYFLSPLDSRI